MSLLTFIGPPNHTSVVQAIASVQPYVHKLALQLVEPDPKKAALRLSECFRRAWSLCEEFRTDGMSRDTYFRAIDITLKAIRKSDEYFSREHGENDKLLWTLVVASKVTDDHHMLWFTCKTIKEKQSDPKDSSGIHFESKILRAVNFDVMGPTLYQLAAALLYKADPDHDQDADILASVLATVTFSPDLLVSIPRIKLAAGAARLLAHSPAALDEACGHDASLVAGRILLGVDKKTYKDISKFRTVAELAILKESGVLVKVTSAFNTSTNEPNKIPNPQEDIHTKYTLGDILGKGSYGQVVRAERKSDNAPFAIKIMQNLSDDNGHFVYGIHQSSLVEIASLQLCRGQKHIVSIVEAFMTEKEVQVVYEACECDLSRIIEGGLSKNKVRKFSFQFLCAVDFLHSLGFIHRDLKPQNILILNDDIKVADAGFIYQQDMFEDKVLNGFVQSLWYRAPELLSSSLENPPYSFPIDMWSVACIISEMATGSVVFRGKDEEETMDMINATFPNEQMDESTEEAEDIGLYEFNQDEEWRDFLTRIYDVCPESRIRADEALVLPFFKDAGMTRPVCTKDDKLSARVTCEIIGKKRDRLSSEKWR
jgi:serine/threonine protein kinase